MDKCFLSVGVGLQAGRSLLLLDCHMIQWLGVCPAEILMLFEHCAYSRRGWFLLLFGQEGAGVHHFHRKSFLLYLSPS